jgi:hypothetical protein
MTDAFTTVDSPTSSSSHPRAVIDTFTTSDTATRVDSLPRTATDAFITSDVATRTTSRSRAVADAITFTDVATGGLTRTVTFVFGPAQPKWQFGQLRNTNGDRSRGGTLIQSALSRDYVQVSTEAFSAGLPIDPTTDVVEMAFTTVGDDPVAGDWKTGSWDTAPGGTFLAQCLVGPSGTVTLTRGIYAAWVRVTDNPERPVAQVGQLQIV